MKFTDDKADGHDYPWLTKPASHIALTILIPYLMLENYVHLP